MDVEKSEIRELTAAELDAVSGGVYQAGDWNWTLTLAVTLGAGAFVGVVTGIVDAICDIFD